MADKEATNGDVNALASKIGLVALDIKPQEGGGGGGAVEPPPPGGGGEGGGDDGEGT